MGLFSRFTARIDRVAENARNVARQQIERDLRACGLLGMDDAVVSMAEANHMNQRRTQWGHVWVITAAKTIVWLPRERRPLLVADHSDASTFTGGNFSAGMYVAYVVDKTTRQNLIKDHFMDAPEEFAKTLDSMRAEEEQRLQTLAAVAANPQEPTEQSHLTDHIDQMMRLAETLWEQGLISDDEHPTSSSLEIESDENGEAQGPGPYIWIFTNCALHIIRTPVSRQILAKVKLDYSDPGWTIQVKANPADRRMLIGLIRRDGVGVHGGALLATNDAFTASLTMLLRERPG